MNDNESAHMRYFAMPGSLFSFLLLVYGGMGLIAAAGMYLFQDNLALLKWTWQETYPGVRILLIIPVSVSVLVISTLLFQSFSAAYGQLQRFLLASFGGYSYGKLVFLAFLTALAEEMFFRGMIQPSLGLFGTALLFGVLHSGFGGIFSLWSLWAFAAGMILGRLTEMADSLLPAVLVHFAVNAFTLVRIGMKSRSLRSATQESSLKEAS